MQFMERIKGMFIKPEETIKDILKEPRFEEPLMIVGVLAIITFIANATALLRGSGGMAVVINALLFTAVVLVGWPIATGIVHAFALFLGGDGKYSPQMLNAIGYTYVVKIIPALIGVVLLLLVPPSSVTTAPQITQNMSMDQIKEAMQPIISALEQALFNPFFILYQVIGYLALIWSCYLGAIAVKEGDKVSRTSAYIAVFVPMVISIILGILVTYGSYLLVKMMYG